MIALPDIAIPASAGLHKPAVTAVRRAPAVMGVCLILLLAASTATVFVSDAWPVPSFQIGVFALLAIYLVVGIRGGKECLAHGFAPWLVYLLPVWGMLQILGHTTASTFETREGVLRWGALAAVFFLSQTIGRTEIAQRNLLSAILLVGTAMALLCIIQLLTSEGRVLWMFPTGYPDVYATFPSYNNYAQFVELVLPIALWRAVRHGWRAWWNLPAAGFLFASVISSASRMGVALCAAELVVILAIGLVTPRGSTTGLPTRSTVGVLLVVPVLAAVFTFCVGWDHVWLRLQDKDPYKDRGEFLTAAADMAMQKPLTGFGLNTFPVVYPRYAVKDFADFVNYAHNDWAEFAAEGGIPFLLLVLIPFAAIIPTAIRNPWGLGLVAVMAHACVDYPFPRPAVSGWIFAILGLLYMARTMDAKSQRSVKPIAREVLPPLA